MKAIHITDPETTSLTRLLADKLNISITDAVKQAVKSELIQHGLEPAPDPTPKDEALNAAIERDLREMTLEYTRFRAKQEGKKRGGSRVYQMLSRHGALEVLRRLVSQPTDGLRFVVRHGRRDLAFENIVLKPEYASIISDEIKAGARRNLEDAGQQEKH
jgi:hypothetical protein